MILETLLSSCLLLTVLAVVFPLISLKKDFTLATKMVKLASFISSIPLLVLTSQGTQNLIMHWSWFYLGPTNIDFTLQFDTYSLIFIPIALFVTWNIMEFSTWYMASDPNIDTFFKYLLTFLVAMIILVSAGNIFILFIGWEGVGIMSFLLIGWYHARINAGIAALQAILYNRIGDIGFVFSICSLMTHSSSLDFQHMFSLSTPTPMIIMIIIAAASKSAQFSLHPWLASAMEGPTPVSALLHSSTMVVAGIFLLIRISPIMQHNQTALTTCLCLGAISTLFAATCALTQNDLKKIIAYSTSSQLGLMMVAIGLNLPNLAFFHICTHAFFKAMLFLCSGSIIHSLNNEQDIRKMGGLQLAMPITTSCISIGSLALMGTPFLAGFFSKDAIIESMNSSAVNTWALSLTLVATSFTAVYSIRLIFFASLNFPRSNPANSINENNPHLTSPLIRLSIGSITAGFLISKLILPSHPMTHTLPFHTKLIALLITSAALFIAIDLAKLSWTTPPPSSTFSKTFSYAFYNSIVHRSPYMPMNLTELLFSQLINTIWLKLLGPEGLASTQLPPIKKLQDIHAGMMTIYLTTLLTSLLISLILRPV